MLNMNILLRMVEAGRAAMNHPRTQPHSENSHAYWAALRAARRSGVGVTRFEAAAFVAQVVCGETLPNGGIWFPITCRNQHR